MQHLQKTLCALLFLCFLTKASFAFATTPVTEGNIMSNQLIKQCKKLVKSSILRKLYVD